jgi:hypothetical protein
MQGFSTQETGIKMVPIDNAGASGDLVLKAVAAGRMFILYAIYLQPEGNTDLTLKSGATALTGPIAGTSTSTFFWSNAGAPIARSIADGGDLVLGVSAAVQVNGWATYATAPFSNPST